VTEEPVAENPGAENPGAENPGAAARLGSARVSVEELAERYLRLELGTAPVEASLYGLPGYDDQLPDPSAAAAERAAAGYAEIARHADETDRAGLAEVDLATLDFLAHSGAVAAAATRVPLAEFTLTGQMFAALPGLLQLLPQIALTTPERAEGYLARLAALPDYVTGLLERHRAGQAAGRVGVARLARGAVGYLDALLADPALGGLRMAPPGATGDYPARRDRLLDDAARPALRRYRDAIADELLPGTRDDDHPGLLALPDGEQMYAALAQRHISLPRSAEELHTLGLALAEELTAELRRIGPAAVGSADAEVILNRMRVDPQLRYRDGGQMIEHAERALRRAEQAAPAFFGAVPDQPCQVRAVPAAEAPSAPPAYYYPPALDGSRPGTYFLNTHRADQRARYNAEAVAFHEAVPGHHFQMTLAQQALDLPLARRIGGDTAAIEGWGLYAERLADEMGLYSDELSRLGMVGNDLWRAARLVLDTGLHARGWTRDRAVRWMQDHTPVSAVEIETEVDRYIAYPGQALAYMVGRIELQRLRRDTAAAQGERFDLRAFHDLVLAVGPLPLAALGCVLDRWTTTLL
jgi:uncharacterized protein (DUF885 family)